MSISAEKAPRSLSEGELALSEGSPGAGRGAYDIPIRVHPLERLVGEGKPPVMYSFEADISQGTVSVQGKRTSSKTDSLT